MSLATMSGNSVDVIANLLDSIGNAKAVARAWLKILKAARPDSAKKAEVRNEIKKLVAKWRAVDSYLEKLGDD